MQKRSGLWSLTFSRHWLLQAEADAASAAVLEVQLGLGRIVALHHRTSASYQIHEHIRCLHF